MPREFKNFYRVICEAANCEHDETDWKRDQACLAERIRQTQSRLTTLEAENGRLREALRLFIVAFDCKPEHADKSWSLGYWTEFPVSANRSAEFTAVARYDAETRAIVKEALTTTTPTLSIAKPNHKVSDAPCPGWIPESEVVNLFKEFPQALTAPTAEITDGEIVDWMEAQHSIATYTQGDGSRRVVTTGGQISGCGATLRQAFHAAITAKKGQK